MLTASVAISVFAMQPVPDRPEQQRTLSQAEKLAGGGDFRGAATAYETLAADAGGQMKSRLLLRAARYWLNAGEIDNARLALGKVQNDLPTSDAALRATVAADLSLRSNQAERALGELDQIRLPLPTDLAPEILRLRSAAQFTLGRAVPALNSALERERFLNTPKDLEQNRAFILTSLQQSAARGADLQVPAGVSSVVAGWLELGRLQASTGNNPFGLRDALGEWRQRYPNHPAAGLDSIRNSLAPTASRAPGRYPAQVAVLLPLSGRLQSAGAAVREGIMAAALEQEPSARPPITFYDTAVGTANAYQQAINAGASFVIGPLSKEEISAVANGPVAVPTLALNYLPSTQTAPGLLFQFALDPEDEARQAAARIIEDGLRRGVAFVPNSDWGRRVAKAFTDELAARDGAAAQVQYYEPDTRDYSSAIRTAMLINESRARANALSSMLGTRLETQPRSRGDAQFVFVGAQPAQGRLLRPALRFHIADPDLPIYATSDIYEASEQANSDLNDVRFPDMPWMIGNDARIASLRGSLQTYWPNGRERLFAFGYDAFRLAPLIASAQPQGSIFPGATGRLAIDQNGRVRRQLDWAYISAGRAVPIASKTAEAQSANVAP